MKEEHKWKLPKARKLEGKELEDYHKSFTDVEESIEQLKKKNNKK